MNEPKHTPGPWEVYPGFNPGIEADSMSLIVFGDEPESFGIKGRTQSEKEANARLIAAAPCLLSALESAVECGMVPSSSESDGGASKYSVQVKVADQIRAAIAKAKG